MPLTRRNFMMYSSLLASSALIDSTSVTQAASLTSSPLAFSLSNTLPVDGAFVLSALPYADNALEPVITANTLSFHYGKHHQGYISNLNALLALPENNRYVGKSLEQIIQISARRKDAAVFTNAAQAFNHTFYWDSLRSYSGDNTDTPAPEGRLLMKLNSAFGDYETFKTALLTAAVGKVGSGWIWLVQDKGILKIVATSNADTAFVNRVKPLLVIDVWEHAYYLDWQNRRKDHVSAVIAKLLNWEKITARFNQA
jgi:Fe-Mn family superoxide dismutase